METEEMVGVPKLAGLFWQLGGADPELLLNCPSIERVKFSIVALFNIVISAALATLTGAVVARLSTFLLINYRLDSSYDSIIFSIFAFFWVFALVGIIRLLVFGVHSFTLGQSGPAFPVRTLRTFVPAILLAAWGTAMVFALTLEKASGNEMLLAFIFVFQIIVLLSPIAIASMWTSPIYDRLLRQMNRPQAAPFEGSTSSSTIVASAGGTKLSDEQRGALEELQKAFNRNPRNFKVGRALIDLYLANGALYDALPVFDALIIADPTNIELIREKASIYRRLGDDTRYRKTLEQVDQIQVRASFEDNVGKQLVLRELEMRDLAFFGSFKWEFQPGLNILLGKNGYGKSHLLRALVATLQSDEKLTEVYFKDSESGPMIRVDIDKDGQRVSTVRSLLIFDNTFGKVPVLAIPDMRYIDKSRGSIGAPAEPVADFRSQGARHFLQEQSYEGLILNFLYELCLDYLDGRRSFDAPVFKLIENSINTLAGPIPPSLSMPAKPEFRFHEIKRRDNARFDIFVLTEGNESKALPLQKASQGTLSVVAMIGLVYKYLKAIYKDVREEEIPRQQALVVIDEIDAHLHPSWQQRIVGLFRDTFPNVQFIVTAHSPLVVAGSREGEVAILRRTAGGFAVEVSDGHFIGATAAEMYRRVFEIEEKDQTYLRLGTLHIDKTRIETEFRHLEEQGKRDAGEEHKYEKLSAQLADLRKFEIVRGRREDAERLESRNRDLEVETLRQQGAIDELSAKLARQAKIGQETRQSQGPT